MATATPTPLRSASRAYSTQSELAAAAVIAVLRAKNRPAVQIARVIAAYQVQASTQAAAATAAMLAEQNIAAPAVASVATTTLAGFASTGAPLAAAVEVTDDLARLAASVVADTWRQSTTVAMTVRPKVSGWIRMLNPPSCSRCIILAGKHYEFGWGGAQFHETGDTEFPWAKELHGSEKGFQRHPLCDCIHVPVSEDSGDDLRLNPSAYFDSLSPEEQDEAFGKAAAEAIRLGADMSQVVNARRGMEAAQVFGRDLLITREGVTRYGVFGKLNAAREEQGKRKLPVRLMPESLLALAGGDRDEALRLLQLYGYIL